MTTYTMNIGLSRNDGLPDNSAGEVLSALYSAGWLDGVHQLRIANSDTERTLIVQVARGNLLGFALYSSAGLFAQDCIAVRDDNTGEGRLIGPGAAKWGDFNPDYFLEATE